MDQEEFVYLSHSKEALMTALERYDNGVNEEDVVGRENENDSARPSYSVLVQVLLEFICNAFVENVQQREKLLEELCSRLSKCKIVNKLLLTSVDHDLRIAMRQSVVAFMKKICKDIFPNENLDCAANFFGNSLPTPDLMDFYCKKFTELAKIGQGGFGVVYKAKCKVTNYIYAVKKITFDYKNDAHYLKVLREANNIATLNHPNVVRYYSAWLEMVNSDAIPKSSNDSDSYSSSKGDGWSDSKKTEEFTGIVIKDVAFSSSSSSFNGMTDSENDNRSSESGKSDSVIFTESAEGNVNENSIIRGGQFQMGSSYDSFNDMSATSELEESGSYDPSFKLNKHLKVDGALYIQMEFCDCDLSFWLDKRASGDELPFVMDLNEIFINILNGVIHIHSKGIIHRDLKPQNIFYSKASNILKIGDFGLATLSNHHGNSNGCTGNDHSTAIGTYPYAAPEQLNSKKYDTQVDIYSLGVILLELMNTCSTRMEFLKIINKVKEGKITDEMKELPKLANIVRNLISDKPKDRMPAKEILNLFEKDSEMMKDGHLKEEIECLRSTIQQLNLENERLRAIFENKEKKLLSTIDQQNLEIERLTAVIKKTACTVK